MRYVCLTGTLIWLLSNCLFETVSAESAPAKRLVVLGDSLTAGYGIPKSAAYPALLQEKLVEAGEAWKVVNGGRSGDTTKNGLLRLRWLLKQPVDLLIIALGGNDGLRGLSAEEMKSNLQEMVALARKASPQVEIVLAGMEMPDNMGEAYVEAFQAVFPEVAKSEKVALVPFLLEGVGGVEALNLEDGIHPNEKGHQVMAETVWKVVEPLVRSPGKERAQPDHADAEP
jgi:acyl-CoA thioesterase-1